MILNDLQSMLLNFASNITGGDSTAKGLVVVWFLGTITYMCKSIPTKVWEFVKLHSVLRLNVVKDGDALTSELFISLERWLIKHNKLTLRNQSVTTNEIESTTGFGYGNHLVFCKGRLYKISKNRIEQSGTEKVIDTLFISTIGRNPDIFSKVIGESKIREDVRYFWVLFAAWGAYNPWMRVCVVKPWPKLFIDPMVKSEIDKKVLFFKNNRQWYIDNNIPYKLTIILHGEPGTGKTSLVRYISDLLGSDIYNITLNKLNMDSMQTAALTCRKGIPAVLALEDFEAMALSRAFMKKRNRAEAIKEVSSSSVEVSEHQDDVFDSLSQNVSNLSLSDFLNMLQGLNPIDNLVTIMTTNYLDRVDPAVYRKGRTDLLIEVGSLGLETVKEYFEYSYKKPFPSYVKTLEPIKACDMEGLFRDNPFDSEAFIVKLLENYSVTKEEVDLEERIVTIEELPSEINSSFKFPKFKEHWQ